MAEHSLLSHGRVSAEELRGLLRQEEGLRLEFKKKYDLTGQEKGKRLDELAKDLLALLNTAGRHADDYAYLILGAGDELHDYWTRDYEPVPPGQYTQKQFLGVVNGRCIPDVLSIEYQEIELDGRQYGVVILPPLPTCTHSPAICKRRSVSGQSMGLLCAVAKAPSSRARTTSALCESRSPVGSDRTGRLTWMV